MIARVLPREEWGRLPPSSDLLPMLETLQEKEADVVVVEEGDRIVASWAVMRVTHLEGLWIDPERRGNLAVARRLMVDTFKVARKFGRLALTGANTDEVRNMLERAGASKMPMDTYMLAVGR